jgi:hypothetical protein
MWMVAAILALAGCGSDVTDSTEYRALRDERDTLAEDLTERESSLDVLQDQLSDTEGRLSESEANAANLERQLGTSSAELTQAKKDLRAASDTAEAFAEFASESAYQLLGVGPRDSKCLAEGLVGADDETREAFWQIVSYAEPTVEGSDPPADLVELFGNCGLDVEDYMLIVMAGNAYGDNPELDALYDECAAGDGYSCDELFFNSEIGSQYETFGMTCGERFENDVNAGACFDAISTSIENDA